MTDVYIVDDHKLVVDSIALMIDNSGAARVAGRYYTLASCRAELPRGAQGILFLDVVLTDGDGVDFCSEAVRDYPGLRVVMLSGFKEFNIAKRALHNGALGYVLKNSDPDEIFAAIETVSRGEKFLCEQIDLLLEERPDDEAVWLTGREREILCHIAAGLTSHEVADKIQRGVDTVRHHRQKLLRKLGARNMVELIRRAEDMKLLWPEEAR